MKLVDNLFKNDMVLNQMQLFPTEVVVHVTKVICSSHWTWELVGERLIQFSSLITYQKESLMEIVEDTDQGGKEMFVGLQER